MKKYEYYTIYQTTNLLTGKFCVGVHATNNLNDSYLESGTYLNDAIKKTWETQL